MSKFDYFETYSEQEDEIQKPYGTNDLGTRDVYISRKLYEDGSYPEDLYDTPINFWNENKHLYGRVDLNGNAIIAREQYLKQIGKENHFALNFVVDAFELFQKEYVTYIMAGRLSKDSIFGDFKPKRSWTPVDVLYEDYITEIMDDFSNLLNFNRNYEYDMTNILKGGLKNFDDYINKFIKYSKTYTKSYPITLNNFVKSNFVTPLISGLVIEIAEADHSDDFIKFEDFILDPNFSFFATYALKYGFKIDKNAPWRLVADLDSPFMKKHMKKYGLYSAEDVLKSYFQTTSSTGIATFRKMFYNAYVDYVIENPIYARASSYLSCRREHLSNKTINTTVNYVRTKILNKNEFDKDFDFFYWMIKYIDFRAAEEQHIHPREINSIVKNIKFLKKNLDNDMILMYIDKRLNSCFNVPRQKMREDETETSESRESSSAPATSGGSGGGTSY